MDLMRTLNMLLLVLKKSLYMQLIWELSEVSILFSLHLVYTCFHSNRFQAKPPGY